MGYPTLFLKVFVHEGMPDTSSYSAYVTSTFASTIALVFASVLELRFAHALILLQVTIGNHHWAFKLDHLLRGIQLSFYVGEMIPTMSVSRGKASERATGI